MGVETVYFQCKKNMGRDLLGFETGNLCKEYFPNQKNNGMENLENLDKGVKYAKRHIIIMNNQTSELLTELKNQWKTMMKTLRVSYIKNCEKNRVTPLSDEEIKQNSYSWEYGDWTGYTETEIIERQTHTSYYHSQEHAWKPFAQKMQEIRDEEYEEPELVTCMCGHSVEKILVMNASLGTTCPECYDKWSD